MSSGLFDEFDSVSAKQWKQLIQFELDGADFNDTLVWNSNEDISVKPFYHSDDFKESPEPSNPPATPWKICQTIFVADVIISNKKAVEAIENGAESIKFILPSDDISILDLLKHIDLEIISLYFELHFLSEAFIEKLAVIPAKAGIHIQTDIIGNLARHGNWFENLNSDFTKFSSIVAQTKSFDVDVTLYQNAGANMVQQLAYAMAHATEYMDKISDNETLYNIFKENSNSKSYIVFNVSVGSNYFFEIAKLRALRLLWNVLADTYGINTECLIIATPSIRNKTIYDYNTNLLRTTTECMSAILGGANTICNLPYDVFYNKTNEFSTRISRNQLLILKYESYLSKVNNPADGAYYVESLTNQLAEKALALFKEIEASGGFLKQLKEGTIQRKIKESAAKEQQQFDTGEAVLLGSNKHPNPHDKMKDSLELYPFVKTKQRKTLIEPIIEKRLAEKLEQNRLKTEDR